MLESKHYTAFPSGSYAFLLLSEYRKLLLQNLVGYLNSIQSSLKLDISFIRNKYQQLDASKNFSPAIYSLFAKLIQASSKGEVQLIADVLHQLNILSEEEILNCKFQLSSILTEFWETDYVNRIRGEDIPNENNDKTLILPILSPKLSLYLNVFNDIKTLLQEVDLSFYNEVDTYVTRLKLFNGKALRAATSASVFGAIYLRLPNPSERSDVYFAEHIIHETSHLNLDILLAFDQIILNEETERFKAPIRIDPRPMFGIFHATFVLSRMVRVFQRIIRDKPNREFTKRLEIFRKQFDQGLETVEKHAVLTQNGQRIKASFIKAAEI